MSASDLVRKRLRHILCICICIGIGFVALGHSLGARLNGGAVTIAQVDIEEDA